MKQHLTVRTFLTLLILVPAIQAAAQRQQAPHIANGPTTPMEVGTVTVSGGIGVGSYYDGDYYNSPFGLKAVVETGVWQAGPGVVTLGGEIGGSFSSGGYQYNDYSSRTVIVAARAAWHYGWQVPGLDTYGGVSAGLGFHHYQYDNPAAYTHNAVLAVPGIYVGASYFVTPTFGFNAEAGHDITDVQVGIIFKLQ